jgi:phosphatidate cytidylyltransferase
MNNTLQRLLLFAIAIPLLVVAVFFVPHFHHGLIVALILVFTGGGGVELARLFNAADIRVSKVAFALEGIMVPCLFYASTFFPALDASAILLALGLICVILFAPFAFLKKDDLASSLSRASAYGFALLYPGLLGGFAVLNVASFPMAQAAIVSYAVAVVGNDSLAWLFGVTLGKRRNLVAVSPNKSLAGFIGGLSASGGLLLAVQAIFPAAFPVSPWLVLAYGLVVGASVIIGDLFESALKRSAGMKDSGIGVPGRGGFLDSFDSELFAAPVFYAGALLLGLFR